MSKTSDSVRPLPYLDVGLAHESLIELYYPGYHRVRAPFEPDSLNTMSNTAPILFPAIPSGYDNIQCVTRVYIWDPEFMMWCVDLSYPIFMAAGVVVRLPMGLLRLDISNYLQNKPGPRLLSHDDALYEWLRRNSPYGPKLNQDPPKPHLASAGIHRQKPQPKPIVVQEIKLGARPAINRD